MSSSRKYLEWILNAAAVCMLAIIVALLAKNVVLPRLWPSSSSTSDPQRDVMPRVAGALTSSAGAEKREAKLAVGDLLAVPEYLALRSSRSPYVFVDTRERDAFDAAHAPEALNIPFDEIAERAPHEVAREQTLVLMCESPCKCKPEQSRRNSIAMCNVATEILASSGFRDIRILDANIGHLREANIPLASSSRVKLPRLTLAELEPPRD